MCCLSIFEMITIRFSRMGITHSKLPKDEQNMRSSSQYETSLQNVFGFLKISSEGFPALCTLDGTKIFQIVPELNGRISVGNSQNISTWNLIFTSFST